MNGLAMRCGIVVVVLGFLLVGAGMGQEAPAAPAQPHNNVRPAIRWKQSDYTCEGGAKVTVYLGSQMAKVRFGEKVYVMKQTRSADGNRYSDGKVVWWGKGNGGFLQEDAPDGDGKMILKGCKQVKP